MAGRLAWPGNHPAVDDSIDYLNDSACPWLDQNRPLIDKRVAVAGGNAKFSRHPVIHYSGGRQDHSDPRILAVAIRGAVFAYHIFVKSRSLIDAQQAANSSRDAADDAADHATDRSTDVATFYGATCGTSGNALSLGRERRGEQSRNHGYSESFLHRHFSVFCLEERAKHRPSPKVPPPGRGRNPLLWPCIGRLRSKTPARLRALAMFRGE
jgi:hypothetical protein